MRAIPEQHRARRSESRCIRGFTLLEALVTIGIITVLISILLPTLSAVREHAKRIKCASNMEQICLSLLSYEGQNNGWTPPQTSGVIRFADAAPMFSNEQPIPGGLSISMFGSAVAGTNSALVNTGLLYCPDAGEWATSAGTDPLYAPTANSDTSYMPNGAVMATQITRIPNQSQIVALTEYAHSSVVFQRPYADDGGYPGAKYTWQQVPNDTYQAWHQIQNGAESFGNVHGNGGNYGYLDGHVQYSPYQSMRSGNYGLSPDQAWSTTNGNQPDGGASYLLAY